MIKITMSKGEPIVLSEDQAKQVLASQNQIVTITKDGKWTGLTINKAHIVSTRVDFEADRSYDNKQLKAPPEPNRKDIRKRLNEIRKELSKKLGWL